MFTKRLNILMIANGGSTFGGVENFYYQYYSHIDKSKIHWDFLFCRGNSLGIRADDSIFKESTVTVMKPFKFKSSLLNYYSLYKQVRKYLKINRYDIVHINTGIIYVQIACLRAAVAEGVPVRISHSHSTVKAKPTGNFVARKLKMFFRKHMRRYVFNWSSRCLACGIESGEQLFGKNRFDIIKNAFDTEKFRFNLTVRARIRDDLLIPKDSIVIGTVGRLSDVKNPFYSIRIFYEVSKIREDARFIMVGDGDLRDELEAEVRKLGIQDKVFFLGARNDVPNLLQAMDGYLMPSMYEGLSVAAVEAQAAGLSCLFSNTIPIETGITNKISFASIGADPAEWSSKIIELIEHFPHVTDDVDVVKKAGYDIRDASKVLLNIYMEEYNKVRC